MSIKTVSFNVNVDGITPNVEQFGGTMGDHRVTRLEFVLADELFNCLQNDYPNKNFYRFDIYDGGGGVHTSSIEPITNKTVAVELEEKHTRYGGKITAYLILTALSNDNETQIELYSFPVKMQLKNRPEGVRHTTENYESVAGFFENVKKFEEAAKSHSDIAKTSAQMASAILNDVKDTVENTLDQTVSEAIENFEIKYNNDYAILDNRINDINNYAIRIDNKLNDDYYTKSQIDDFNYADKKYVDESIVNINTNGKVELQNYYTKQENDIAFATIDDRLNSVGVQLGSTALLLENNYYTKKDIDNLNYADKNYVDNAIENVGNGNVGTTNYDNLLNKPQINGVELSGNKTLSDLDIKIPDKLSDLNNDTGFIDNTSLTDYYTKNDIANLDYANKAYVDEAITKVNTGGTVDLSNYYTKGEVDNHEGVKHIKNFNNNDHIVIFETSNFLNNNSSYIELSDYSGIGLNCAKDDNGNRLPITALGSVIQGVGYPVLRTDAANKQYVDDAIAGIETGGNNETVIVDQDYNATSSNAQSGIAVAEAISAKADAEIKTIDVLCFSGAQQNLMTDGTYSEFITNISFNENYNITVFDFSNGFKATTSTFTSVDEIENTGFVVGKRYNFVVQNKKIVSMAQIQSIADKADKTYVDTLIGDIKTLLGGI